MLRKASKYILIFLLSCSIVFLTACSAGDVKNTQASVPNQSQTINQVSKDMEVLTSDECGGRRVGTPGNIKAKEFIVKRFKEIGLEPLDKDYALPYKKQTESINEDKIKLEILNEGQSIYTFEYGKDYVENILEDIMLTLPLSIKPNGVDCILLDDGAQNALSYRKDSHVKLILAKSGEKYTRTVNFYALGNIPQIAVSNEAFAKLQDNLGKMIRFYADTDTQEIIQENAAGVIQGENRSCALLVSAHFDHLGSIGEPGSAENIIWQGAMDNASGVSVMLEAARCLKNLYKDKKPPCDIVLCAFNAEETMGNSGGGSAYFLKNIKGKYNSVFNINLDCLGNKGDSTLFLDSNESMASKEATQKILESLKKQNVNTALAVESFFGDHKTFENAVLLTTMSDIINANTLKDTPERIDTVFLSDIAGKIAASINDVISTIDISSMESTELLYESGTITEEEMLTISDFEKKFNCKLDFTDNLRARIKLISRIGIFDFLELKDSKTDKVTAALPTNISDIRYFHFFLDSASVAFTTYKIGDSREMEIYKEEMNINGYDKLPTYTISIGNCIYNVFAQVNGGTMLTTEFNNKDILIRISISSSELAEMNKPEQYEDFFNKHITNKLIDGMVGLLKEKG